MFSSTLWKLGFKSLTLHPMRSLLTVLGIFIGIASVIWLLAIGEGISVRVQKQIEELGTNNIILRSVLPPTESSADVNSRMAIYRVTRSDFEELTGALGSVDQAAADSRCTKRVVLRVTGYQYPLYWLHAGIRQCDESESA
ncbi:MAG: ABC transporter permease [Pirellulaceae bacterium]